MIMPIPPRWTETYTRVATCEECSDSDKGWFWVLDGNHNNGALCSRCKRAKEGVHVFTPAELEVIEHLHESLRKIERLDASRGDDVLLDICLNGHDLLIKLQKDLQNDA